MHTKNNKQLLRKKAFYDSHIFIAYFIYKESLESLATLGLFFTAQRKLPPRMNPVKQSYVLVLESNCQEQIGFIFATKTKELEAKVHTCILVDNSFGNTIGCLNNTYP